MQSKSFILALVLLLSIFNFTSCKFLKNIGKKEKTDAPSKISAQQDTTFLIEQDTFRLKWREEKDKKRTFQSNGFRYARYRVAVELYQNSKLVAKNVFHDKDISGGGQSTIYGTKYKGYDVGAKKFVFESKSSVPETDTGGTYEYELDKELNYHYVARIPFASRRSFAKRKYQK